MIKVRRNFFLIALLCLFSGIIVSSAQNSDDAENQTRFWELDVPDGAYKVALNQIISISQHEYMIDGGGLVTEVNIDTQGAALVRVYFLRPLAEEQSAAGEYVQSTRERLEGLAARGNVDAQDKVLKQYPLTTHAKTIEFRVKKLETLEALYKSVDQAWTKNRGRTFKVKSAQ